MFASNPLLLYYYWITGILIVFVIPFFTGFLLSFYVSFRILSKKSKKNKMLKLLSTRIFLSSLISIIPGIVSYYILYTLFFVLSGQGHF